MSQIKRVVSTHPCIQAPLKRGFFVGAPPLSGKETRRILCVGVTPCLQRTIRFSSLQLGQVNRAHSVAVSSGGKSINVARTLKALKESPLVAGFAGGETGNTMVSFLGEMGIETDIVWTDQPTRICTTLIDRTTACVTELVEEAPLPTPDEWSALDEKLSLLLAESDIMVVAGAPPPGSPEDIYARFARRAQASGVAVLIDARGEALMQALAYLPVLAKLNDQELVATCGRPIDTEGALRKAAQMLISGGAQWVLITQGKKDAWLLNETLAWRFTPPAVHVLNAVGSGDATTAGIAAGLVRGQSMPDAVQLGIACGSANATTLTPGDVDADLVKKLVPEVGVAGSKLEPVDI
ncbi:1-phosphofructokinase family hexose kinase [Candidatus Thiosymbion oneisti]|uniref:1-phosphofructokinase family hexose kinase n=1 Tax=Candidatus Thiosymbion oneisti TaxID=589554 RepID=UPI000B7D09B7|nr:1-phosphofructokinase family hexose kinase [Candidatus Thiosymbion oneisti]